MTKENGMGVLGRNLFDKEKRKLILRKWVKRIGSDNQSALGQQILIWQQMKHEAKK